MTQQIGGNDKCELGLHGMLKIHSHQRVQYKCCREMLEPQKVIFSVHLFMFYDLANQVEPPTEMLVAEVERLQSTVVQLSCFTVNISAVAKWVSLNKTVLQQWK